MTFSFQLDGTPFFDDPSDDDLRIWCRNIRANLLQESDWRVLDDAPGDRQAWITWRQSLRDFGDTWTPSTEFQLPEPPA